MIYLKKITYLFRCMMLLLMCILLHSCLEDVAEDCSGGLASNNAYVSLQFGTRSTLPSVGENAEVGVNSLRVIIFDKDGKVEINNLSTATNLGRVENPVFRVSNGEKRIYVIANENGRHVYKSGSGSGIVTSSLSEALSANTLTEEGLKKIIIQISWLSKENIASIGLLMVGSTSVNVIGGTSVLSPQFVSVEIARVSSKLEINVRKIYNDSGVDEDVVLKSVRIRRMQCWENLYQEETDAYPIPWTAILPTVASNVTVTAVQTDAAGNGDYQPVITCFPGTNTAERDDFTKMALEIIYSIAGNDQQTVEIPITKVPDFKVRRNTHYIVNLTIHSNRLDVTMDVKEWNVETVDGDIDNESAEIITNKSLIEMDWWELGKRFDTELQVSAGAKKPVVFDGYYISEVDLITDKEGVYGAKKKIEKSELGTKIPWLTISNAPDELTEIARNGTMIISMKYTPKPGKPQTGFTNSALVSPRYDDLYLRFRSGNIIKDIKVKYQNGYITDEMLSQAPFPWPADKRPLKKGSSTEHSGVQLMRNASMGETSMFRATQNREDQTNMPTVFVGGLHGDGINNNLLWPNYNALYTSIKQMTPLELIRQEIQKFPKWGDPASWFIPSRDELMTILKGDVTDPNSIFMHLAPKYNLNAWCAYDLWISGSQIWPAHLYKSLGMGSGLVMAGGKFDFFSICYADI